MFGFSTISHEASRTRLLGEAMLITDHAINPAGSEKLAIDLTRHFHLGFSFSVLQELPVGV